MLAVQMVLRFLWASDCRMESFGHSDSETEIPMIPTWLQLKYCRLASSQIRMEKVS